MQPIFTRKNWAINTLIEFRESKTIYEFTDYFGKTEDQKTGWDEEHLEFQINHLYNLFEGLKEELNQTIHTSNALTVTTYFEELKLNIQSWNLDKIIKADFIEECKKWNAKKYSEFLEEVEKKETKFFNKPERTKYAHLEKYSSTNFSFFTGKSETTTVENKNFLCIEDKPKLIDLQYLDKYLKILSQITDKFNNTISQELNLYNSGKITAKIQAEKSNYDKAMSKIKNNKIIVGIIIGFLIYGGISEIIKRTKENKENLFGKDGLINNSTVVKDSTDSKSNQNLYDMKTDSTKVGNDLIKIDSTTTAE